MASSRQMTCGCSTTCASGLQAPPNLRTGRSMGNELETTPAGDTEEAPGVFVSYKREDRERVIPLVEALEAAGLEVWWDRFLRGGDSWREELTRRLEEAGASSTSPPKKPSNGACATRIAIAAVESGISVSSG